MRKQVTIHSSGHGGDTVIVDSEGNKLDHVRSATITIEAGEFNEVEIVVRGSEVKVEGAVKVTYFNCELCGHEEEHICEDDKTVGGGATSGTAPGLSPRVQAAIAASLPAMAAPPVTLPRINFI